MLSPVVKALVLFFLLITLVAGVNAQSMHRFKVNVPFQFVLNGKTLQAGTYFVERIDHNRPDLVTIKRVDGGIVRLIVTQRVERDDPSAASSLVFIQREGKQYLFQVWNTGAMNGRQIPSAFKKESGDRQRDRVTLLTLKAKP